MTVFFCDSKPETLEHLFWYCDRVFPLWSALANWIGLVTEIEIKFSLESVILGYTPYSKMATDLCTYKLALVASFNIKYSFEF